jgi:hypothetical protein
MIKDYSKTVIGTGTVLASAAVIATVIGLPLEDVVSPCFDHPISAAMCRVAPPVMADDDEKEPATLQVQQPTLAVTASSSHSIKPPTGRLELTGFAPRLN